MTREEAINRIFEHKEIHKIEEPHAIHLAEALDMAISALQEPERKKGKWIKAEYQDPIDIANGNFTYICTNCFHADISAESQEVPFCWHCGAKMGGKE